MTRKIESGRICFTIALGGEVEETVENDGFKVYWWSH
jgi:hypothetical protein